MDDDFGLFSKSDGALVPLKSIWFDCVISEFVANVAITQGFANDDEVNSIETEFVFPVEETSAMVSLVIKFPDGREIAAKVEEKKKAAERYEDAISSGHTAFMAVKRGKGSMALSVGNLAPKSSVEIIYRLVFPVGSEAEKWKFVLPGALTPFKVHGTETIRRSQVPYTISFSL
jgi:hypothetical protein